MFNANDYINEYILSNRSFATMIDENNNYANNPQYYGYSPFAFKTTLNDAILGNPVTKISKYRFYQCDNFKELTYNSHCSPTSVDIHAFNGCKSIESDSFTLPESVVSIGDGAFANCTKLAHISFLPNSVKTLGASAFANCTGIVEFNIPDTVGDIAGIDGSDPAKRRTNTGKLISISIKEPVS